MGEKRKLVSFAGERRASAASSSQVSNTPIGITERNSNSVPRIFPLFSVDFPTSGRGKTAADGAEASLQLTALSRFFFSTDRRRLLKSGLQKESNLILFEPFGVRDETRRDAALHRQSLLLFCFLFSVGSERGKKSEPSVPTWDQHLGERGKKKKKKKKRRGGRSVASTSIFCLSLAGVLCQRVSGFLV